MTKKRPTPTYSQLRRELACAQLDNIELRAQLTEAKDELRYYTDSLEELRQQHSDLISENEKLRQLIIKNLLQNV